jgi:hypothetical protein
LAQYKKRNITRVQIYNVFREVPFLLHSAMPDAPNSSHPRAMALNPGRYIAGRTPDVATFLPKVERIPVT